MREMRDSGVEWIGDIPSTWEIRKVKSLLNMQTGFTPDTKNEDYYSDEGVDWVTIGDLSGGKYIPSETKKRISNEYVEAFAPEIVPAGSLLYSFKLSVGQTAFTDRPVYTNEAIASFIETDSYSLEFLRFAAFLIEHNANTNIYGARLLNQELIKNALLVAPSIEEQRHIATFLDERCNRVDALIANVQAQIEKLKAYKQSLITEVVTKGLNPNVPMKDSGVEWIGEIPEHWRTAKLQYCAQIRSGITLGKKYPKGTRIIERPYLRVANVQNGGVVLDDVKMIEVSMEDDKQYRLSAGEVLMTEGGDRDKLGRGCVWEGQITPCLHQNHIFALRTNGLLKPQFLAYATASDVGRVYFDITAMSRPMYN